jgi:regulator of protease activity HflC (stomatin/prohibitin superfamily)
MTPNFPKTTQIIVAIVITILLLQVVGFFAFDIVKTNDRELAVITRFGKAQTTIQGWGIKVPWIDSHAVTYDSSVQSLSVNTNSATSDQQTLIIKVNVQYRIDPSKGIDIYRIVKNQKFLNESIIPPFVQEAVKASTVKFTASELLNKRDIVKTEIENALGSRLKEYYSTVVSVNLENIDWSDAYDKAIEAKVIAQQEAEKAKQTLEKTKIESEIELTKAKAEAEALKIRGEALRTNPENLEKAKIDKWDGRLPQVTGSGSNIINLEKK